jgi:hypothetical protein
MLPAAAFSRLAYRLFSRNSRSKFCETITVTPIGSCCIADGEAATYGARDLGCNVRMVLCLRGGHSVTGPPGLIWSIFYRMQKRHTPSD